MEGLCGELYENWAIVWYLRYIWWRIIRAIVYYLFYGKSNNYGETMQSFMFVSIMR
jgi:hypothetical protein